ncbi:MAG: hypothetical protein P1V20_21380 [Verrucomicrobiales bacterium]|nr:hypothetical protein [Verrucomicrobiales bacterium]
MNIRTVSLLAVISSMVFAQSIKAGGSVSFEEVRGKIPGGVARHIEAGSAVAEVGEAIRLGRHFTHLGGARIGPYRFEAISKAAGGSFEITIVTEVQFLGQAGNATDSPEEAAKVSETFLHYEVRPGGDGAAAELSDQERKNVVALAKKVYNEVSSNQNLRYSRSEYERDETSGTLRRGYDQNNHLRMVELSVATGDHGGFKVEIYCNETSIPSFVLWEDSYWSFDPDKPGETIDNVAERRFYFSSQGQLARSLEKVFQGTSPKDLLGNRDQAKNYQYAADPHGAVFFFKTLKNLTQTGNPDWEKVINDLHGAQNMMDGPDGE